MKRGMDAAGTSIFLVGCMACAIGEGERACRETGGLDRDENGWRRVDVSLVYVGGGEDTTFVNVGNNEIFHGIL